MTENDLWDTISDDLNLNGSLQNSSDPMRKTGINDADLACPRCGGRGYIVIMQLYEYRGYMNVVRVLDEVLLPPGADDTQWRALGYIETASNCDCVNARRARQRYAMLLAQEGVSHDAYEFHFSDFKDLDYAQRALYLAQQMIRGAVMNEQGSLKAGLLLSGPTGCGKTTLGSIIIRDGMVMQGKMAVWCKWAALEDRLRATYERDYAGPSKQAIQDEIAYAPLLQIDDLGSLTRQERYAEDVIKFLFNVFDHRYAKQLPTIITTNLSLAQLLAQFGPQVMTRLRGLCHACEMNGPDFRLRPAASARQRKVN